MEDQEQPNEAPTRTPDITGLEPILVGPWTIGFVAAIHGVGSESKTVTITRDEAERVVQSYLLDIVGIDETWELFGCTGSWEIRMKPYAWGRIDDLVKSGLITKERVQTMAKEAYAHLEQELAKRDDRINQIAQAVGATVEGGEGKLGDMVFESGGEGHDPEGQFLLHVTRPGSTLTQKFESVSDAVAWLKNIVASDAPSVSELSDSDQKK